MLKNPKNASTRSASTEKSPIISTASPFVLRLSKDERRFFSRIYELTFLRPGDRQLLAIINVIEV